MSMFFRLGKNLSIMKDLDCNKEVINLNLDDVKLSSVKYQMKTFTIDAGGTTFDVPPSQIASIKIEKNYDMMNFPFYYFGVNLPGWFYIQVVKNSKNLHITFDLHQMIYRTNFDEKMANPTTESEIKGKFIALIAIDTPVTDEALQMQVEKDAGAYQKSYTFNEYYFTEFAVYNEAAYKAKSKVVNAVLESTNMTSTVAFICKQAGITNNILMSPLTNRKTYTEFKIPPINAIDQLKTLIVNYKLHDKGTILFFDLNQTYIISKEIKCTAWKKQEYKTVHVMSLNQYSSSLASGSGYFKNTKEKYHLIEIPPNSLQTTKVTDLPASVYNGRMNQTITFYTNDVVMEALTPNKLFIVDIQSSSAKTDINGKYRIMRYSVEMENGGDFFNAKFNITLGKDN